MGEQFFPPKSWVLKWKSQYKVWDAFLLVIGQASEVPQTTQVIVCNIYVCTQGRVMLSAQRRQCRGS